MLIKSLESALAAFAATKAFQTPQPSKEEAIDSLANWCPFTRNYCLGYYDEEGITNLPCRAPWTFPIIGCYNSASRQGTHSAGEDHSKMVKIVQSPADFKAALEEAAKNGDLVVVDFFAEWCGPCKVLAPKLDELSKKTPGVVFLKVDVDHQEDLAKEYSISAMPTLILIKDKKKVAQIVGANLPELNKLIAQHTSQGASQGAPALAVA